MNANVIGTFVLGLALCGSAVNATPVSFFRTVAVEYRQGNTIIIDEEIVGDRVAYTLTGAPLPAPDRVDLIVRPSLADLLNTDRPPSGGAEIRASVLENNYTYVSIDASLNNSIAQGEHVISASVSQSILGANPFATAIDLEFAFDLKEMSIEIVDQWGAPFEGNPFDGLSGSIGAQLSYAVMRDGWTLYHSVADYWGGRDEVRGDLVSGIDGWTIGGIPVLSRHSPDQPYFKDPDTGALVGEPLDDKSVSDLYVGRVSRGETYEVTAVMSATLILPEGSLGSGARLSIGDPNALTGAQMGTVSFVPAGPAPVPVPSVLWLLWGGMGSLALCQRRKARLFRV